VYPDNRQTQWLRQNRPEWITLKLALTDGEPKSPIGPLVASAVAEGYPKDQNGVPTPFRGYFYRILTRQGKAAHGGTKNYIANGEMTEGFAFVAYPAEYRSSGVMTFIVGADGVVYQKDLGKRPRPMPRVGQNTIPIPAGKRSKNKGKIPPTTSQSSKALAQSLMIHCEAGD
jgi:hypothetical protein